MVARHTPIFHLVLLERLLTHLQQPHAFRPNSIVAKKRMPRSLVCAHETGQVNFWKMRNSGKGKDSPRTGPLFWLCRGLHHTSACSKHHKQPGALKDAQGHCDIPDTNLFSEKTTRRLSPLLTLMLPVPLVFGFQYDFTSRQGDSGQRCPT